MQMCSAVGTLYSLLAAAFSYKWNNTISKREKITWQVFHMYQGRESKKSEWQLLTHLSISCWYLSVLTIWRNQNNTT